MSELKSHREHFSNPSSIFEINLLALFRTNFQMQLCQIDFVIYYTPLQAVHLAGIHSVLLLPSYASQKSTIKSWASAHELALSWAQPVLAPKILQSTVSQVLI